MFMANRVPDAVLGCAPEPPTFTSINFAASFLATKASVQPEASSTDPSKAVVTLDSKGSLIQSR
jgi:hypothetical protein